MSCEEQETTTVRVHKIHKNTIKMTEKVICFIQQCSTYRFIQGSMGKSKTPYTHFFILAKTFQNFINSWHNKKLKFITAFHPSLQKRGPLLGTKPTPCKLYHNKV